MSVVKERSRGGSKHPEPRRERLQKVLARAGAVPSRRQAEELIRAGRVTINGAVAELGVQVDPRVDSIKVDGRRVKPHSSTYQYLLLNKPRGVMSTTSDPEGRPTVIDLVPPGLRKALVPVGRLDFQTEGLLILTDDGELAHRVAHPRFGCTKRYEVKVKGTPTDRDLDKLRQGIYLDRRKTAPCQIEAHRVASGGRLGAGGYSWWTVILQQGRTRQIREMFLRIGHSVQRLRRAAIGPITAAGLPVGDLRPLTEAEVDSLRRSTGQAVPAEGRAGSRVKRTGARPAGVKGGGVKGAGEKRAGAGRAKVKGGGAGRGGKSRGGTRPGSGAGSKSGGRKRR